MSNTTGVLYIVTDLDRDMLPATATMLFPGIWQASCDLDTAHMIAHDAHALNREIRVARTAAEALADGRVLATELHATGAGRNAGQCSA